MSYADIRNRKPEESSLARFLNVLLVKLAVAAAAGIAGGVFCRIKFRFEFLPAFGWIAGFVAVALVVVLPIVMYCRRMNDPLQTYTVIDIETTGLRPQESEITELAALRVRGGKVVGRFQELVAISGEIPKAVIDKTGITKNVLARARPPKKVLKAFFKFIGNDLLVGYNLDSFDVPFVNFHATRQIHRVLQNPTLDVWKLAKKKSPGLDCYKLDSLRSLYGLSESGAHRALKDCEDTNEVYRVLTNDQGAKKTKAPGSRSRNLKSIYRMSDRDLQARFGNDWQIAAEIIASKRELVETGINKNWESVRSAWDPSLKATTGQISMLTGLGIKSPARLSKMDASLMIDELMLEADVKRESARRAERARKEAEKAAKAAAREERKAEREEKRAAAAAARAEREQARAAKKAAREAELEHYDGPRMTISPKCAAKWRDEFTCLWNGILSDDVIEVRELVMLKGWLNRHKRRRDDFHSMLKLIDEISADGVVDADESQRLYAAAVEVLDGLASDAEEAQFGGEQPVATPEMI